MPELPEVETVARGLNSRITGKTIESVEVFDGELLRNVTEAELREKVVAAEVTEVSRRGKYVLVELDGEYFLAIHLRMTGKLLLREQGEGTEYQRISFTFAGDGRLVMDNMRRFGTLDLVSGLDEAPLASLGLEPFTDNYSWRDFRELFETTQPLKLLLLDQKKVSGLGNIYASEALFRARLDPRLSGEETSEAERRRLYEAIPEVLAEAIEHNGTTFSNFRDSNGEAGSFQEFLDVYQKEGEPCPVCGSEIVKVSQSGRSTYYCPDCQAGSEEGK